MTAYIENLRWRSYALQREAVLNKKRKKGETSKAVGKSEIEKRGSGRVCVYIYVCMEGLRGDEWQQTK